MQGILTDGVAVTAVAAVAEIAGAARVPATVGVDEALWARGQMGMSLAFHIVFAAVGMAMPLLMVLAELRWRRTGDRDAYALARAWSKGAAVLFAVGAVSGTVLSFELGLLFPGFMRAAGAVVGMPFSLEGFAFFTEAIFLGIYLYGWDRVSPRAHVAAGFLVAASGVASAIFVTLVNAWMNAPRGVRVETAVAAENLPRFTDIDPLAAMASPFALHEVPHMVLAAFMSTALAVAAIHAWALLRHPDGPTRNVHRHALTIAIWVAIPSTLLQPLVGHFAGHQVARYQPLKLAALEQHEHTSSHAPVHLGPIAIPSGLSILAFDSPSAVVEGLDAFPVEDRPHPVVRVAFQVMVLGGFAAAGVMALALWLRLRRRAWHEVRWLLGLLVAAGPLGFVALEAGWTATEMGRQPWIVYGVLRTAQAVTPMPGLRVPFVVFTLVYLGLAATVAAILSRHVRATLPSESPA